MNLPLPTVWTNDDISTGNAPELRRQLELIDRFEIPGVFFVIPENRHGPVDRDRELLRVIEAARERGHEFYQHGYRHFAFECGIPCLPMFELDPKAARCFDADREGVEAFHTLEALVTMLENGQRIWRRAFGENSPGFRPGWGSYCGNLYKALTMLGYSWVSSRLPSMTTYLKRVGEPVEFFEGVKTEPHRLNAGIWEFPIGAEVAWRVPNDPEFIDGMVALGVAHQRLLAERGHPSLLVSHYHGLSHQGEVDGHPPMEGGTGYAIHEKLLPLLREEGLARYINMSELTAPYLCSHEQTK